MLKEGQMDRGDRLREAMTQDLVTRVQFLLFKSVTSGNYRNISRILGTARLPDVEATPRESL
jgi:hypothetical protein